MAAVNVETQTQDKAGSKSKMQVTESNQKSWQQEATKPEEAGRGQIWE